MLGWGPPPPHSGTGRRELGEGGSGPKGEGSSNFQLPSTPTPTSTRGPRGRGGRGAGLEDRTSSWQDTGRQAGGSQPQSRPQGKGHWGLGLTSAQITQCPANQPSHGYSEDGGASARDTAQPDPPRPHQDVGRPTPAPGGSSPGHPQGAPRSMGSPVTQCGTSASTGLLSLPSVGPSALGERPQAGPGRGAQGQFSGREGHGAPSPCTPTMESSSSRACRPRWHWCLRPADCCLVVAGEGPLWRLEATDQRLLRWPHLGWQDPAPGSWGFASWPVANPGPGGAHPPHTPSPGVSLMPTQVPLVTHGASAGPLQ